MRQQFDRKEVATKLKNMGIAASTIRSYLNGTRRPSLKRAIDIEHATGVPVRAWSSIKQWITEDRPALKTSKGIKQ